ncbi:Poly [ADP-ribose] polymerase 1 [Forsythia ovata]|uniref:Poly [ADP-ribose] polymerase n=1 Tax=Forsythia ovata TaxID=205694 RepID=A0ABD1T521_9LAMI
MLFGALARCELCSGWLRYASGMYRCCGYLSEWSKCSYSTAEPQRVKGKWKIPEDTSNEYLLKWFKSQKAKKPARVLPPSSPCVPSGSQAAKGLGSSSKVENIGDLKVAISGVPNESIVEWKSKIEEAGGQVHTKIKKETNCLVISGAVGDHDAEIRKARRMKLPIVREDYLVDCIKRQKKLPFDPYKIESVGEKHSTVTVKDYGVNKDVSRKKELDYTSSQLAPQLVELMKMLFNVETYRAAMMEFEINLSEMPLGKLGKSNIQKGFEALTQIQNVINSTAYTPSVKESLLVDASNRFFTVIPSIVPHVIKDEDDFKLKVQMLEALQDIEIASRLVGFDVDNDESIDEKYKKLRCHVSPLPHDGEDYQLIEKYIQTTHAPTHTDVFSLEREGEFDKYAPHRAKLKNKMLLWHGSRLTNFVGILSQGLRIAPPEAPATGYMFGKGIYFADLVSKSAQYCFTDKKNPVGLMLLSEVALGEVYELRKAKYMDKPPEGKHSTKGLGKKVPLESEYVKWRDEVVVPCGKPVASNVKASELMYNEYIVYDTAQVKLQFLLKVKFHHKR